ncbi:MAG: nucleotide exchange factor GrpE [Patescibacteria group bacterium]|jgi:molecular chaperone GrpE
MVKKKTEKSKKNSKKDQDFRQELKKLEEQLKRALADYDNLEKRINREKNNWINSANEALIDKLLFVFDDLERACQSISDPGLSMVRDQFWKILSNEGVEKVDSQGKKFNAQTMDAQELVPGEKEKVIEETCPGYLYQGKCLRPAKVKVGQGKNGS